MEPLNLYRITFQNPSNAMDKKRIDIPDNTREGALAEAGRRAANEIFGVFEYKVIKAQKLSNGPRSPKQVLHWQYISMLGPIAMMQKAQTNIHDVTPTGDISTGKKRERFLRDSALVRQQIAKLKRDVQDMFRNLGLKIK